MWRILGFVHEQIIDCGGRVQTRSKLIIITVVVRRC
jgi:hypothetical protein